MEQPEHLDFLLALNRVMGNNIYSGGADRVVVAKRRKANKVARKQRKINAR